MRKIASVLLLALLFLAAVNPASPCAADGTAPTDEFIINADPGTEPFNGSPSIAWDGTNFLAVWLKGTDIYGARVSPDGEVLDPGGIAISVGLNSNTASPRPPSVAFDGTNYLVAWVSSRSGAYEVYGCRVSPGGAVLDPEGIRITTGGSPKAKPVGIARGAADCLVVWRTSADRVMGVRVDADGAAIGNPSGFQIAANGFYPAVAYDAADGLYLVTWHQGSYDWPVCGARVTDAEQVLDPAGIMICNDGGNKEYARPAFDGTNFMVIWYDWRSGDQEIGSCYGARVTPAGAVLDDPSFFITGSVLGRTFPNIVFDGTDYLAVWSASPRWSGDTFRLPDAYAARISTGGTVLDRQAVPLSTGFAHQTAVSVAYGGGRYITAWFDLRHKFNNGKEALYSRILDKGFDSLQTPCSPQALPAEVTWDARSIGIGTAAASGLATDSENARLFCGTNSLVYQNGTWSVDEGIGGESASFATGASDIWAGGWAGFVMNQKNGAWQDVRPDSGSPFVTGIWGNTHNDMWASLSIIDAFTHFNGSKWENVPSASPGDVQDIMGAGPSDIWAVGERGAVQHWNGTAWSRTPGIPTLQTLNAVWVNGPSDVFAVGDHGTILHYDGTSWTAQTSPTTAHLKDVWGVDGSCVYAVGTRGAVLRYDGSAWSLENAGTANDLLTVFGGYGADGTCRLWAAGYGTAVYSKTISAPAPATAVPEAFSVASAGIDSATLAWTLPDDRNVTGYVLEYRADGAADWTAVQLSRAGGCTVSGLDNAKVYAFRLMAQYRYAYRSVATAEIGGRILKLGVIFNTQGGSDIPAAAVSYNSTAARPPDPGRDGFLFGGWYTDTSCAPDKEWNFGTPVTANIELFARWLNPERTVTLDRLDGTVPVQVTVNEGEAMACPTNPVRDGYIFGDWYTGSNLATKWNFADAVLSDMTLYAKWIPRQYVVTFDYQDGGTPQAQKAVTYDAPYGSLPQAERLGYIFDGWYTQAQGGERIDSGNIVIKATDHTLFAHWTLKNCIVTFDRLDGTVPVQVAVDAGKAMARPADPVQDGYTFFDWYTGNDCVTKWNFADFVWSDMTLYARWVPQQYVVTFDYQDASKPPAQKTVTYNTPYGSLPQAEREGHDFSGWYTQSGIRVEPGSIVTALSNHTLYARWTARSHTITFDPRNGEPAQQVTVNFGAKIPMPAQPSRADCCFTGWYRDDACTDDWVFTSDTVTGNITLYAGWASSVPAPWAASVAYNAVRITWQAVPGADGYEVWRAPKAGGTYTLTAAVAAPEYINSGLTAGVTYYYKVRSYAGAAHTPSSFSAIVSAAPVPAPTAVLSVSPATYNSIKITWAAVAGATKYELWRATSPNGKYKRLTSATSRSYTDRNLSTGIPYYYKVTVYRTAGSKKIYGAWSEVMSARTSLGAPGRLKAARAGAKSVTLSWSAVAGRTKYEIWRSDAADGVYVLAGTTSSTKYTDKKLTTGQTYWYKVRAYRTAGKTKTYGGWAGAVSAQP